MNCQAPYKAGYEYRNYVFNPLYTALFRLLCTASGHLPGKGNYMRTPKEFDYFLWTEKGDTTRYYVKLKSTGETTEVSREVMRCLRNEERRMRREIKSAAENPVMQIDQVSESTVTNDSFETEIMLGIIESDMLKTLTDRQRHIYNACVRNGIPMSEFAAENGVSKQSIQHGMKLIRKKMKKLYGGG